MLGGGLQGQWPFPWTLATRVAFALLIFLAFCCVFSTCKSCFNFPECVSGCLSTAAFLDSRLFIVLWHVRDAVGGYLACFNFEWAICNSFCVALSPTGRRSSTGSQSLVLLSCPFSKSSPLQGRPAEQQCERVSLSLGPPGARSKSALVCQLNGVEQGHGLGVILELTSDVADADELYIQVCCRSCCTNGHGCSWESVCILHRRPLAPEAQPLLKLGG
jgi:hypothetical protein